MTMMSTTMMIMVLQNPVLFVEGGHDDDVDHSDGGTDDDNDLEQCNFCEK